MDYKFTVFTPCYNGEKTIHRVFESMNAQTYTNWEWIIINDGSTDDSDNVIKKLIAESKWGERIQYLKQLNSGKHVAWNRAVKIATGHLFVPADCDDSFVPDTLEFFNQKANELCGANFCRSDLSGISVCCYDPDTNQIVGTPYPQDGIISNDIELAYKYHLSGEKWGCVRVDLLKQRPFPELKGHYYNESFLWYSFPRDGYAKANYNKKVRAYYYEPESLCNNKRSKWDADKAFMFLSFNWWKLYNIGHIIRKYSVKDYLALYKSTFLWFCKWVLCKVLDVKKK